MRAIRAVAIALVAVSLVSCARMPVLPFRARAPLRQLQEHLDTLFDNPKFSNAYWGVLIQSVDSGEVIYARNENKGFVPASNMKLYTTATALALLGADFRYETRIVFQGNLDSSGTLHGDVIIIGSGDPSISGRYSGYLEKRTTTDEILNHWTDAFTSAGIRRIEGNIIGDDDIFVDNAIGDTWEVGYLQYWYAAPSDGLSLNENCYSYIVTPGENVGDRATIEILPATSYVSVVNDVITTLSEGKRSISLERRPYENTVTFGGVIPVGARPYRDFASLYNGTLYTATLLRERLVQKGINVKGIAKDVDDFPDKHERFIPACYQLIHSHVSPPLATLIPIVNKPSQNFYADMFLKTLAKRFKGEGSFQKGEEVVKQFLREIGAPDVEGFDMADGSGLARKNLVQPRQTVTLLRYMKNHPAGAIFYDSLPIAGVDGTIRGRMRGTAAEANVHAKTGYIERSRALSGYVTTRDHEVLIFSMMANAYTVPTSQANAIQDQACALLADFSRTSRSPIRPSAMPELSVDDTSE